MLPLSPLPKKVGYSIHRIPNYSSYLSHAHDFCEHPHDATMLINIVHLHHYKFPLAYRIYNPFAPFKIHIQLLIDSQNHSYL